MIGDSVAKTIRSGTRLTLIRLRRVMVTLSDDDARTGRSSGTSGRRGGLAARPVLVAGLVGLLGAAAGEGEEHVVEVGAAQPDVEHLDAAALQPAQRLGEGVGAAADRDADPPGLLVDLRLARPRAGRSRSTGPADVLGARPTVSSSRCPPTCALSSSPVPRAMTRPRSMTTIESASRSASSRYCVVSRIVVPPSARSAMNSHMPSRLRGSRPGGRLVEEQHPRPGDQRGGDVEPAAHAAGVGLRRPGRRVREVEPLQQLARARPRASRRPSR